MSGILQLVNTFGPSGPFAVKNSLRLRSSANAYLSRVITLSATWTLSVWVKRGSLGVTSPIFGASVLFNSNDTLTAGTLTTTSVYRDPSAWYHIVVSNSGCYVNGVSVGSTATGILVSPLIGSNAVNYFDGYLAELNLVDGQALTPSSFGAFDATSGVWQPTRYSGTYGTNGFYLKFSDTTSTTTLCYDYSGNGNNWTPNNISLTAGSTYDSMLDSPTNYDNGGTGVGNYCVMNAVSIGSDCTLSDGNLGVAYGSSGAIKSTMATIGMSSGKWYCEFSITGGSSPSPSIGISSKASSSDMPEYIGYTANGWGYYIDGTKRNNAVGGGVSAYGATWTTGDIIGIAFDADAGSLTFYKNGTSQGVAFTGLTSGPYYFGVGDGGGIPTFTSWFNFGQRPFSYTPPTGYKALNTQNLPAASIVNGAAYMNAVLRNGFGTSGGSVTSLAFQPDFFWEKARNNAYNHQLVDSVRGVANVLNSNLTNAENSQPTYVTSFNSNGYTLGSNDYATSVTLVDWVWKANGTAVTNNAGSITSQVSANTTAGFSVLTWTGNGSTATVGHGLGVAPSFIILKYRNISSNWSAYHASVGNTGRLALNLTDAVNTSSAFWNNTSPTSTVFSLGSNFADTDTYVAYCFAAISGYSAFGSYTGNGSSDGPFVFTGFRPRYVLIKSSSSVTPWDMFDSSRYPANVSTTPTLFANDSSAEINSYLELDLLSNGFKIKSTGTGTNGSGSTYIYSAFAENPFKYSLAR